LADVRELVAYRRMCWVFDKGGGLAERLVYMPLLVKTVVEVLGCFGGWISQVHL